MSFSLRLVLGKCHKQVSSMTTPKREHFIDDIIPDGVDCSVKLEERWRKFGVSIKKSNSI